MQDWFRPIRRHFMDALNIADSLLFVSDQSYERVDIKGSIHLFSDHFVSLVKKLQQHYPILNH